MSTVKTIARNALSNGVLFVTEVVVVFLMMPFIIHRIGDTNYGLWVLVVALTGYLSVFKLGLRPAINKFVAQYKALKQYDEMKDFLGVTLILYICSAIAIMFICIILPFYINSLYQIPDEYQDFAKYILLMIGAHSSLGLIETAYGGVISGYQRYDINSGIEISVILARSLIILLLLPHYPNLYTLIIAHFSTTFLGYCATIIIARNLAPIKNVKIFRKPPVEPLKKIVGFTSISVCIGVLSILTVHIDSFIIGSILSVATITHYTIGSRLVKYSENLLSVISNVIAPATSTLNATNEHDKLSLLIEYSIKVSCIVIYPVLICLIIQGGDFISLWMGEVYELSHRILVILSTSCMFYLPQRCINPVLFGIAKHTIILKLNILQTIISIPLSIYLGKQIGVEGIALGMAVPMGIVWGIIYPIIWTRYLKVEFLKVIFNTYLRTFLAVVPFACFIHYCKILGLTSNLIMFATQLFVGIIIYIIMVMIIAINKTEKQITLIYLKKTKIGSFLLWE